MKMASVIPAFAALTAAGLFLSACNEEEQGRKLDFKPGVYQGNTDTQLTQDQRDALRMRSRMQGQ